MRCVCKSLRSLISDPKFARTHLSQASTNTDYTNHRLILITPYQVESCSLYSIWNEKSESAVRLDCPLRPPYHRVTIWGCCDGLLCIGTEREVCTWNDGLRCFRTTREVCIWNPSTRKYKGLPGVEMSRDFDGGFARFGFGYDDCIDDYKVVGFFFDSRTSKPKVKVYTLRSNSWGRLGDCPHRIPLDCLGTFVNRALHWIQLSASSYSNDIIVSLERFRNLSIEMVIFMTRC
ncbi:hypothetical protein RHMOL_Rhmol05G0233400 [Rhododendron molle]|uniref:Uncharacterized protein n=1 Tax=Rhododendron molle TaxID=49168 RepID=A0ACC0NUK1_RHOML|nr:hypothetical protein RHMOL_Rhmol05G0233400 [Rhododendron molle]